MNFGLSFTNPLAWLLWSPLAFFFVWVARRSLANLSVARRNLSIALRLIVLTLVISALAGAQLVRYNRDQSVMFVVDYSDSVGPDAKTRADRFIQQAVKDKRENDFWGRIVFGREAFVDQTPSEGTSVPNVQTVPPTEFTDLAAAIRLAMASLPDGTRKRIVVLSDGNENLGEALQEAPVARANDVAIDVVPLTSPARREVLLENLNLPGEAKIGEPVDVRILARSTVATPATIKLFRNGKYLGSKSVELNAGRNAFAFPQTVDSAGAQTFEAQIEVAKDADTQPENNRALGFVNVRGQPKVLLVDDDPNQARFLVNALKTEKVNVELRGAGGLPTQLREMQPYDAIILGNVPAWELSEKQMLSLQAYVRDLGCGLVMVGGENSFGPGGYRSTPIEEALPVTMDIKNQQFIPGGAVAMIMHSLEFQDGNEWAKAVCSQVTRQLGDNDYAGLVIFGMKPNWVYPMLKVGPNRSKMLTQIRGINPGDMPDFDAALELCYSGLINTKAYLKHVIILSDGDPSPPAPELVARFNAARITVSTVAIQPHDNSGYVSMKRIADQHGGRFYRVANPRQIPNIFLKEAATVSRSAIIEGAFVPRLSDSNAVIKGITQMPPLLGYVGTSIKDSAQNVLTSKEDDPILATWQYGLGRGVAFTSDARQRWAAGWIGWSGYSKFWAQTVRWCMRQSSGSDLQTLVNIDKGRGKVTVEAVDASGNLLNFLDPKARLVTPDLKGEDLSLDQVGPGRYQAEFDARRLGTYLVNIRTQQDGKNKSQVTGGVLPYSPEYNSIGTNAPLLARISDETRGAELALDKPENVFERAREWVRSPTDIWLPLLAIAACLFPLDVACRRLMWERKNANAKVAQPSAPQETTRAVTATAPKREVANQERTAQTETTSTPPQREIDAPPPSAPEPEIVDDPADAMARLRAAKRRARGEDE